MFLYTIIILFLVACTTKKAERNLTNNDDIPSIEETTREKIIGLWETESNGEPISFEFLADGKFILGSMSYDYYDFKFASDQTIAITQEDNQVIGLFRLIKISKNTMVLEENGKEINLARVIPPDNLHDRIIGLWEYHDDDGEGIVEFTPDGLVLHSRQGEFTQTHYKVISDNSIATFEDSQHIDVIIRCVKLYGDTLVFNHGTEWTLNKLPDYPNLSTDIIGLWKLQDTKENILEIVDNGTYILYFGNEINNYTIISGNTIQMDGHYVHVMKISKNVLQLQPWGSENSEEITNLIK